MNEQIMQPNIAKGLKAEKLPVAQDELFAEIASSIVTYLTSTNHLTGFQALNDLLSGTGPRIKSRKPLEIHEKIGIARNILAGVMDASGAVSESDALKIEDVRNPRQLQRFLLGLAQFCDSQNLNAENQLRINLEKAIADFKIKYPSF